MTSKESATKFVQAVIDDAELREKTANIKPEEIVPFAKEMGYDFTLDELKDVKKENIELSPEELEAVAGGTIEFQDQARRRSKEMEGGSEIKKHCYGDLSKPLHNYVKVGHKEEPILWGLLSWCSDWSDGFDVYECTLCKAIKNVKV